MPSPSGLGFVFYLFYVSEKEEFGYEKVCFENKV
jgi:hypothetical protein